MPALDTALESWDKRIPTGRLNTWLKEVVAATPPPMRGGRLPRIMFATQASTRPPTFVLFTTGFLEAGYRRFIERRLREEFNFDAARSAYPSECARSVTVRAADSASNSVLKRL